MTVGTGIVVIVVLVRLRARHVVSRKRLTAARTVDIRVVATEVGRLWGRERLALDLVRSLGQY